jgi:hypothetical protein
VANPLVNEKELYEKIKDDKISIHPLVWDTMYHYLGDYVSAIGFMAYLCVERNEPMTVAEGKEIIQYTKKIMNVVDKILHPEKIENDGKQLDQIKQKNMQLHPLIHEFFMHYIANDTNCINFRIGYFLDPIDENPIPVEEVKKVLNYTKSMCNFLERLRKATNQPVKD